MDIFQYMDPKLVVFLNTTSRDETLSKMIHQIHQVGKIEEEEVFFQAIINREKVVSTGIGMSIAIPHAKLASYNHFFITIGILAKPVDWNALDGAPVQLIFMIGGPDNKQSEYLQILSTLTQAIKSEETRKKLLTIREPRAMIELFHAI